MALLATTLEAGTASGILAYSDNIYDKAQSDFISNLLSPKDKIDDVQVNGTSVVKDKVAKIDLTEYATSSDLSDIQSQVTDNKKSIETNASNIISAKEDISQVEDDIYTLKSEIPTKTSQLENDSNYYKPGDALIIEDNEVVMRNSSGIGVMVAEFSDNNIDLFEGTFRYPELGHFTINSDIDVTEGSIMTFQSGSNISLTSDNQSLNIQSTGISLEDGTAKQLYSTDGNTYDISSLESSVSTNTSNISSIQNTIGNMDTLLTTILNG